MTYEFTDEEVRNVNVVQLDRKIRKAESALTKARARYRSSGNGNVADVVEKEGVYLRLVALRKAHMDHHGDVAEDPDKVKMHDYDMY